MSHSIDLTGPIGDTGMEGIRRVGVKNGGHAVWEVRCHCGRVFNVEASKIKRLGRKSCGCLPRSTPESTRLTVAAQQRQSALKARQREASKLFSIPRRKDRDAQIIELLNAGYRPTDLAAWLGITRTRFYQLLARIKSA